MRGTWPILGRLAALGGVLGVAGALGVGYLGWLHPAFDSFSHFRAHLAVLLIIAILPLSILRYWPEALFALALGAASIWNVAGWYVHGPQTAAVPRDPTFRLFHLNLRFDNDRPDLTLSAIGAQQPDVIALTEVSDQWREWRTILEAGYPHQIICPPPSRIGGVAILSRRPFASDGTSACSDRGSVARADIDFAGRTASVVALHLGWPWPFEHDQHRARVENELATLPPAALVAGDFNAVPWSNTVRQIAASGGLDILRGIGPTWLDRRLPTAWRPFVGLPIDQIMLKGGIRVHSARAIGAAGSDHLPVLVEFSINASPQEQSVEFAAR